MSECRISVIVPVFNVAPYIGKCLDSLLAQSFRDFEVIAVDDGSTDESGRICDLYEKKSHRVKVFHKANGGVSSALNVGLEIAKSPYIYFVDGDDWIETGALEKINDFFEENSNVDIFCFNNVFEENGCPRKNIPLSEGCYEGARIDCLTVASISPKYIERKYNLHLPAIRTRWAKAFKREIIYDNKIRFDERLTLGQDALFCTRCLSVARTVVVRNDYLYHYRVYQGSNIRKYREKWDHVFARLNGIASIKSLNNYRDLNEACVVFCCGAIKNILKRFLIHENNKMNYSERKAYLKGVLNSKELRSIHFSYGILRYVPEYMPFLFMIRLKMVRTLLFVGRFF